MASNLADDMPMWMGRYRPPESRGDTAHGLADLGGVCEGTQATRLRANGEDPPDACEIRILIFHSDPLVSAGLHAVLHRRGGLKVVASGLDDDPAHGATADVVIADHVSGMRLIDSDWELRGRVVILTHDDSEAKVCHALERGARGYLLHGCSLETLVGGIQSVYQGGVALGPVVARRVAENLKQQPLTAREVGVLRRLMSGASNKRIAKELAVQVGTVKTHVKSILEKLHATSRTEAVAIAHRRGLFT